MKNQEIQNVVFTAIDINTLIEKIAEKVLSIIESNIEKQNQDSEFNDLLNTPLMSLKIGRRPYNICKNADIKTLGELASIKKDTFYTMINCGGRTISDLETLLNKYHLTFGMNLSKYNIK